MIVLHTNWAQGGLRLWGESLEAYVAAQTHPQPHPQAHPVEQEVLVGSTTIHAAASASSGGEPEYGMDHLVESGGGGGSHGFAVDGRVLLDAIEQAGLHFSERDERATGRLRLRLPADPAGPLPSDRLAGEAGASERAAEPWLAEFDIPCVNVDRRDALAVLLSLADHRAGDNLELDQSVRYWIAVAQFVAELLADQRFIPGLTNGGSDGLRGVWQPWLEDETARAQLAALLAAMPPVVRASVDEHAGQPWPLLHAAITWITDGAVRSALSREDFIDAIGEWDSAADPHVTWLAGLLGSEDRVLPLAERRADLLRDVERWTATLAYTGQDQPMRLCFRLREPSALALPSDSAPLDPDVRWRIDFLLQSADDASVMIPAGEVWSPPPDGLWIRGARLERPEELLLAELGRASRLYPLIESALAGASPAGIDLTTVQAYEFLRDIKPVLDESGFGVIVPSWWDEPVGRLGARLRIESPSVQAAGDGSTGHAAPSLLGLDSLVKFQWQVAIGDQPLTDEEFQSLARARAPLVFMRGRWIEINPDQLAQAERFLGQARAGEMTLLQAIHIANGADNRRPGLPVFGMDATGWVADVLSASGPDHPMPLLDQPRDFIGTLRPYQKTGLSWLAFLDRFGLGTCLADDMGLGKTIQLIALLLHEREVRGQRSEVSDQGSEVSDQQSREEPADRLASSHPSTPSIAPTLLVVPTSVAVNWVRELSRFAPSLTVHLHHGPDRPIGERFESVAGKVDVVITTYPLVSRDQESLRRVRWRRIALDEAQYIKNPPTKQTSAIRSLLADRRMALTGTPVENRLSELWSIMDFCNPGYLGPAGEFRRLFANPIERHRDHRQADRLRHLVRPFILRRVKTDPKVLDDLPPCLETKEFATLTPQQAAMYGGLVQSMLTQVDGAQGIQRRGLVLATLVRLKQVCNHPLSIGSAQAGESETIQIAQAGAVQAVSGEVDDLPAVDGAPQPASPGSLAQRSGKCKRLLVMLEEVLAAGERSLIFTQFRQMGHLLNAMIQHDLDCECLFLHGGTPQAKRQHMIDRFQAADGGVPVFILSLKAGGLGLNLTAANHVFHFDRWWNPAVENQATDRAFRIGQVRTVHVHKFVCIGTIEERIDQMIEQKTDLARNIIGSGEQWLTELSTFQLREMLTLRQTALEGETQEGETMEGEA